MSEFITPERWLPVVGHEGYYEVSDQGRVRSIDRTVRHGGGHTRRLRGRPLSPRTDSAGYRNVTLSKDGTSKTHRVQYLVLAAFIGPRKAGEWALHENDEPSDNRLLNLCWDSPSANAYDRVRNGNHPARNRECCPEGHLLKAPNLVPYQARKGRRDCLTCRRTRDNQATAARTGRPFNFKATADRHYAKIMKGL